MRTFSAVILAQVLPYLTVYRFWSRSKGILSLFPSGFCKNQTELQEKKLNGIGISALNGTLSELNQEYFEFFQEIKLKTGGIIMTEFWKARFKMFNPKFNRI